MGANLGFCVRELIVFLNAECSLLKSAGFCWLSAMQGLIMPNRGEINFS